MIWHNLLCSLQTFVQAVKSKLFPAELHRNQIKRRWLVFAVFTPIRNIQYLIITLFSRENLNKYNIRKPVMYKHLPIRLFQLRCCF